MLTNVLLLTLSGKNIKKMGLTKYGDFPCLWSNAWKYDVKLNINQRKIYASRKKVVISTSEHHHLSSMMVTRFSKKKDHPCFTNSCVCCANQRPILD